MPNKTAISQDDPRILILNMLYQYMSILPEIHLNRKDLIEQEQIALRTESFVRETQNCTSRSHLQGHMTSSAFILDQSYTHILLSYHRKLQKWVQLGGHAEEEFDLSLTSIREAKEESGLDHFSLIPFKSYKNMPFDLDIHLIPERKEAPEHFHYDFRFLLITQDPPESIKISSESLDLRWVPLSEISSYSDEDSILRPIKKIIDYSL